jgi:hypothetical protein
MVALSDEAANRKVVGRQNNFTATAAPHAVEYFSQTHDGGKVMQYAQKFVSDQAKQNGLYSNAQ